MYLLYINGSKSKFNLKSDRVNYVAPASPIECLLYLLNVRAIQYKPGSEIQMYYGCPCITIIVCSILVLLQS